MPSTTDPEVIAVGLKALRRRRLIVWTAMLAPLVAFAVFEGSYMDYVVPFYFLLMLLGPTSIVLSECPRCGELFHIKGIFSSVSTRYCLHCNLPLKEPPPKPKLESLNKKKIKKRRTKKKRSPR
ncbi:hypothetical protein [Brevifollis gellanilyticus]|uniref:Uncharacterized protein n=1 Tax=Brevifollis gellanilyticus TaxID=748831 RepID=A0A512MEH5_9BACT|nr:hypothetical protein [Brevifollis gellanilyticus]GEP45145.1 hypothetical protein BGE01nite_44360 [Brevifollis gellanilyticus]